MLLTYRDGHHKILTAFECKDWNKKVGSQEVESFYAKTKYLKINNAILVSSLGFSEKAVEKANFYNISCIRMEEVESF